MCKRRKDPYQGLNCFVGGKIELNESGQDAAYRELYEETGINRDDILLTHFIDYTYHISGVYVEVYVGKLNKIMAVQGDENELFWTDLAHNFFDTTVFGGEGDIGHVMAQIKKRESALFKD